MTTEAQQPAAWPEGVIARYLTVGGATVDITDQSKGGDCLLATCTGEQCRWQHRTWLDGCIYDTPEETQERVERRLPATQSYAQEHAERCRAMPKPDGA